MISGRANSMSPPLGVSSKMAEDLSPPPHQCFAISAWQLQQSDFRLDALRSKADSPQRHLFKHLLQLVEIAKAQFHDVARPLFHPSSLLRHEPLGIGDGRRHKQVDTHLAVIRQVQVGALYLLHPDVDAHRLCKAKHLDGQRDRHGFPIHIAYIDRLVKVAGYIFWSIPIHIAFVSRQTIFRNNASFSNRFSQLLVTILKVIHILSHFNIPMICI